MRNINNKDIEALAKQYAEEENSAYANDYNGFMAGFNAALEELQKEYTELKNAYISDTSKSAPNYGVLKDARYNILIKRKDLR